MKKRGLSTVVITLIIILISLVAVGIVWVVVRNVINTGTKEVTLGQFTLDAKIKDVNTYNFSNNVSLTVKRNPGAGEFSRMNFVFYDGKNSEVVTQPISLNELEEKWFMFHLSTLNVSNLRSVSIFPYVKQDEKEILGNILDKYTISGQGSAVILPVCVPATCASLGYECGTNWANGTNCAGTLNCEPPNCTISHGAGYTCNSAGRCIFGTCSPLINNYCSVQGYECGYWGNNSCSGNLSCGTCGSQATCPSGTCVCNSGWEDCNSDNTCECNLASNSCSGGSCVVQTVNVTGNFRYVRQGAAGTNNGSDWINAYTTLPATLLRNYTYYIADGNYGSYIFNTAESGTQYIIIKKATIADRGTDYGWDNLYGDGQAVFTGTTDTWSVRTGYYSFDGVNNYGIKVVSTNNVENTDTINGPCCTTISNITFKNMEIQGELTGTRVIWFNNNPQNAVFKNNYIHGGRVWISIGGVSLTSNVIIENNYFLNATSTNSSLHGAGIVLNGLNITIRNNIMENCIGSCTTYIEPQGTNSAGIYISGNIFKATTPTEITSQGIFALTSSDIADKVFIIGNTIYGLHSTIPGVWCGNVAGSNCTVKNNIWQNTVTVNCNYCTIQSSNILNTESVSFVNVASGNFHLATATRPGETLPYPYNLDYDGVTRGTDGNWDIGAYEYP